MTALARRPFILGLAALAGCGPSEQAQAAELQRYLQTRVLDRQGLAAPRPTPEEHASFGRFAQDYEIVLAFHDRMNGAVTAKLGDVIRRGSFNRAQDFIDRRADIAAAREALAAMAAAMGEAFGEAQRARASLTQPAGLKAAYDKAFDRIVATPVEIMRSVMPTADDVFAQGLAFSDFLVANRGDFKFNGAVVETSRADLLREFNERAQVLQIKGEALLAAQRRLQIALRGQ